MLLVIELLQPKELGSVNRACELEVLLPIGRPESNTYVPGKVSFSG